MPRTLELDVAWLFRAEGSLRIFAPSFRQLAGPPLQAKMNIIRAGGTEGKIALARELHKSPPAFIHSSAGLDHEAAKRAYGQQLAGTAFTMY